MSGFALLLGSIITLSAVLLAVIIGAVVFARRRIASGPAGNRTMPLPVDPGPAQPGQARDVNAEE